jgi:hypothetical protein
MSCWTPNPQAITSAAPEIETAETQKEILEPALQEWGRRRHPWIILDGNEFTALVEQVEIGTYNVRFSERDLAGQTKVQAGLQPHKLTNYIISDSILS